MLRSSVSTAKRKHDKMQSQNGIRISTYVACGLDTLNEHDVIFLVEPWTNEKSNIVLNDYVSHNYYRKFQHSPGIIRSEIS